MTAVVNSFPHWMV